jgi:uncharacterized protein (DUF1778 family)
MTRSFGVTNEQATLADRPAFGLDAKRWIVFLAALEAPSRSLPRLERLLREPGVFDGPEGE